MAIHLPIAIVMKNDNALYGSRSTQIRVMANALHQASSTFISNAPQFECRVAHRERVEDSNRIGIAYNNNKRRWMANINKNDAADGPSMNGECDRTCGRLNGKMTKIINILPN